MAEQPKENKKDLNIEISEQTAEGTYINLAIITHSSAEFIIDFVNVMPGMRQSKVKSRIITNPIHAKRLMHALEDNIKRYEKNFGTIKDNEHIDFPIVTGGPTIQA